MKKLPSLDFTIGYLALIVVIVYVVFFGIHQSSNSFHFGKFNIIYLSILGPIWLIDGLKSMVESFLPRTYKKSCEDTSKVGVVIASKDGEPFLRGTVNSLVKHFSKDQIIVISNGSKDNTVAIAKALGVRCINIDVPIGKVRAINRGVQEMNLPYILLIDDDTIIGDARIPTGLLDQGYEAVAFRLAIKKDNWVTDFQSYEYRKACDISKRYHNKKASVQNISGAIGLFKRSVLLRQIHRHTGEFSGEDLQRTLLIHLTNASKGVVLADSTVTTIAPNTIRTLFRQRVYGWYPGLYSNTGNFLKILTRDSMPTELRLDAIYNCVFVILFDVLRLLSLPILFLYPWYFVVMYVMYVLIETATYIKSGHKDPYWVILSYPIYGLFGFITRICGFSVFLYRRFVVYLSKKIDFKDDYRIGNRPTKLASIVGGLVVFSIPLALNVMFDYAQYVLNVVKLR